jgi:hypothetical protein
MPNTDGLRGVICRNKGCDDTKIAVCLVESGTTKELFFCAIDGCYFVRGSRRKRRQIDVHAAAFDYVRGLMTE